MINGYKAFLTYLLESENYNSSGYTYSTAIHCNYIKSISLDTIKNKKLNIYFNNINDFKFLSSGITEGSGYTFNNIYILIQLLTDDNNKPLAYNWRKYNVTNQIIGHVLGYPITAIDLSSTVFKVPIDLYYNDVLMPKYDLSYLNYPTLGTTKLCFGDEQYFLGNVSTDIEAIAYTTDLAIYLPLNKFNSTNNTTWDGVSPVSITEIGLYDNNKNLVAIGKLNNPVPKDSTISRTIVFGMDF